MRHHLNDSNLYPDPMTARRAARTRERRLGPLWVQHASRGFVLINAAGRAWNRAGEIQGINFGPGVLIVVHPGSLCGSYHTNPAFRAATLSSLLREISEWPGAFALVHGEFHDEIGHYPNIEAALKIAAAARESRRYEAEPTDVDLERAAIRIFQDFKLQGRHAMVTGAWADPADGCVTAVSASLLRLGANVKISAFSPVSE